MKRRTTVPWDSPQRVKRYTRGKLGNDLGELREIDDVEWIAYEWHDVTSAYGDPDDGYVYVRGRSLS